MNDLLNFLNNSFTSKIDNFTVPGYWTVLAAYCRANKISFEQLAISEKYRDYALAIALENALNQTDTYPYRRRNSGNNYSELVLLNSVDDTDKATSTINSCIRSLFWTQELSCFSQNLCDVVGDLHDNVWSHGKSTGFSMAQKWSDYSTRQDCFEFALADCGLGFLQELKRVGLIIENDEKAIEWCVVEGNSSKKQKPTNDWSQRLPQDISGNPMPNIGQIVDSENHHMGLGLAKLLNLVNTYQGQLWLASGEKTLVVEPNGNNFFKTNALKWQGVALACRFNIETVKNCHKNNNDEATNAILELLNF
jgi:hypothetical protein